MHPVLAQIEGVCVGGGLEIASQCDLRIAGESSRFGVPINKLGFPMAPDEMRGLLALAGRAATLEILLEGRVFAAAEAMTKGRSEEHTSELQALMRISYAVCC